MLSRIPPRIRSTQLNAKKLVSHNSKVGNITEASYGKVRNRLSSSPRNVSRNEDEKLASQKEVSR